MFVIIRRTLFATRIGKIFKKWQIHQKLLKEMLHFRFQVGINSTSRRLEIYSLYCLFPYVGYSCNKKNLSVWTALFQMQNNENTYVSAFMILKNVYILNDDFQYGKVLHHRLCLQPSAHAQHPRKIYFPTNFK